MPSVPVPIDNYSRRVLRRFWGHLSWCGVGGLCLWLLLTGRSASDLGSAVALTCTFAAVLAIGRACRKRQKVDAPTLNDWDEGLALNGLSIGIHILMRNLS